MEPDIFAAVEYLRKEIISAEYNGAHVLLSGFCEILTQIGHLNSERIVNRLDGGGLDAAKEYMLEKDRKYFRKLINDYGVNSENRIQLVESAKRNSGNLEYRTGIPEENQNKP